MTNRPDDIAIISLAGRFPGAKTVEQFWQNLAAGVESIQSFSEAEVLAAGVDQACLRDPSYVRAGAPLDDIDCFDAAFFGYSPREATLMDPQQRVFLECAWEALERAGYAPTQCRDRVGVYAGVSSNDYWQALQARPDLTATVGHYQTLLGNDKDFLSSRVSYKLNLKGPSLTVQTACSTSLVATVLACQSLLTYQCDMALAGGVSIHTPQTAGYRYQPGGIFSPDGHCRAFDAQAQGTVGGNGVGIVVLKRLEDAIAAGDLIYAVIRGAAINNDGADKVGYTAPSVAGQAAAIAEALALADVEPETLSYLEAHGTGTALGDPIEIAALTQAFNSSKRQFCAIGSVKANIGHLDAAAGIAGLIKTAQALHHRQLPPSLNFEQPNPQINFASSPFYVNTQRQDWPANSPLRAGVSAMGIGGTNAHVVLEAAPERSPSSPSRPWQVLLLSAKTPPALEQVAHNLAQHLETHPEMALADVAYTLHTGRVAFGQRRMLVCQNRDEAIAALRAPSGPAAQTQDHPTVAFLFPGQGSQYVQMAQELYQTEPDFQQTIDYCAALLKSQLGWDLRSLLYPHPDQIEAAQAQLQETAIAQPVLFVVEYALAQLWITWGIQPQALLGHSLGEYVVACLAGVFSLADALHLVALRGQLMQQMPTGKMLSVALSADQVEPYLGDECWLAVHNAPQLCVVSGTVAAIATLQTRLERDNISCRRLKTSHAFHSPLMEAALEPFRQAVSQVTLHPPQIPLISNVTGTWLTPEEATSPDYWASHLRQPVQFSQGVSELLHQSPTVLLEVGPGRTLATLARQQSLGDTQILTSLRHPQEQVSDTAFLLRTLGQLWLTGVAIDGSAFYRHERRQRVLLPTYPFERQRYWVEPAPAKPVVPTAAAAELRAPIEDWFYLPTWIRSHLPYVPTSDSSRRTWLLFVDERGICEQLARRLMATDHAVIVVRAGAQFQQQENDYRLNPDQPEDYRALVRSLLQAGQFPNAIVHGWSLSLTTPAFNLNQFDADQFEAAQDLGFYSVLYLTQALQQAELTKPLALWLLTNQVHAVTGIELLRPEQATVVGTHAVIAQDCPTICCRSVDVAVPDLLTSDLLGRIVACLWAELLHPTGDRIIAYRSQHRWTQTFEPLPIPAPEPLPKPLRAQGVYLITGGLAGIGNALAGNLAQTVQARLAFLEPEPLPPRSDWPHWLAEQPNSDPVCRKIHHLQRLESLGAEVLVCTAEVSHLAQVQAAIAQIEAHWEALHGVMHTAEITAEASFRPIQQTGRQDSEWQFVPKVKGLQVLAEALAPKCLDFCLVQSSIASQLGGFIAHAAANWFMDALVPALNQSQPTPWISVNWEGWRFWDEANTATSEVAATATLSREEGIETFKRILTLRNIPQVVISTTDLIPRMQQQLHRLERSPVSTVAPDVPRSDRPRNAIEQTVAGIWQDLLGIDEIGIHATFFDLGGHSLLAVQVMSRIRAAFQVELPLRILLIEQPTIAGLAAAIAAQISPDDESSTEALDAIQDILTDLEALSPEDLDALLAKS
ncbi:MAG: acyltransferase domain-containing protein [Tildeniella torsiva UHER 1998/13D]|jgi:acyl transferase domain-containing protein/acyl carrier protein|nr:acyltransferase domain-containing protein [Tildeniella torsiva UHER 1998/13D]